MFMKVFGIGLSRTGTTSLSVALAYLGYDTAHFYDFKSHRLITVDSGDNFDALTDLPVSASFEEFDARFPGSKFIYTVRDRESWLKSCAGHFRDSGSPRDSVAKLRVKVYGTPEYDERLFREAYERHERRVFQHFRNREEDLLVMNLFEGDGWQKLCPFLRERTPHVPFPNANYGMTEPFRTQASEFLALYLPRRRLSLRKFRVGVHRLRRSLRNLLPRFWVTSLFISYSPMLMLE